MMIGEQYDSEKRTRFQHLAVPVEEKLIRGFDGVDLLIDFV